MNFYQAPVTRYLSLPGTGGTATTFADVTAVPQAFSSTVPPLSISTFKGGIIGAGSAPLGVNLFFETPNWPSSTYSINLEYNASAAAAPLLVAPNVMMTDADATFFIRGNSILSNTSNTAVHVVYCANLTNVVPVAGTVRASAANSAWIQPGDRMDIAGNADSTNQSNAEVATPGSTLLVQACRFKTNSSTYLVEFDASIRTDGNNSAGTAAGTFTTSATGTGGADRTAYELYLKTGATITGLAIGGMTLRVTGRSPGGTGLDTAGTAIWTGTLTFAVNLSYPFNNKTGLLANYLDPSRFMQVSKAWAAGNLRPLGSSSTALVSQRIFVDRDLVAGGEPYRCLAIVNPGSVAYQVAVTINPIS